MTITPEWPSGEFGFGWWVVLAETPTTETVSTEEGARTLDFHWPWLKRFVRRIDDALLLHPRSYAAFYWLVEKVFTV